MTDFYRILIVIAAACLVLCQAAWIYRDAGKRGERRLLWGLFGLLNVPSSLIIYLLVTRRFPIGKPCHACGKPVPRGARFCPACGVEQEAVSRRPDEGARA
jgi:hypothetical protein